MSKALQGKELRAFIEARRKAEREAVRESHPGAWPESEADAFEAEDDGVLPDGYTVAHVAGGYYTLTGPEGDIPGPSNGKWQGRDAATEAAWRDTD